MSSPQLPPVPAQQARINGLDGLRAIAVVGVLLYHADVPWARGGFIGVDVFFVLSGYLVSSIVLAGYAKRGNLGFSRFWSARLRRLAPAQVALLVVVTVTVAIWHPHELHELRGQAAAAATGTTNWYLIATSGSYFDQLGRPPVLRHLWSLAVELQFYLLFPPLLVVMLRRWGQRLDRIALALALAIGASTIYLAVLFHPGQDPTRAYFDTFARLAAPLFGALLALLWRPRLLARSPAQHAGPAISAAAGVSLVALLWIMHVAGDQSAVMYRGGFFVTALLSTVVVAGLTHPQGILGERYALGHPFLVAIGLRSYSIYLWHWPVFALLRPRIDVGWSWGTTFVVRIVVTLVLAELSYRFVERPWHLRSPNVTAAGIRARIMEPSNGHLGARLTAIGGSSLAVIALVILVLPHAKHDAAGDSLRAGQAALERQGPLKRLPQPSTTTRPGQTTLPGATTTLPEPAPGTGTVTLVGDSVMVGAAPTLIAAFGDRANIDAKVSRQAANLPPVIRQLAVEGRLGDAVVVQVGINGTVTEDELRGIVTAADGRRVFIVNARVPRSWEQSNNEIVGSVVPTLKRAEVIDWHALSDGHRDWFVPDGVHLTEVGREAYTDLIRRAVDSPPKATRKGSD